MSGGSFNYTYSHVDRFIEELTQNIKRNKKKDEYGYAENFKPETIQELKRILNLCKITSDVMKHTEWLYSGDDSEETFSENIEWVKARERAKLSLRGYHF